ncbi:MAG: phage holin family protein, partial [Acidovorax sp.]
MEAAIAAQDRLDLVSLEWAEQKKLMQQMLLLVVALAALTVVALIMLSLALLVHFWDSPQRTLVAWAIAAVWAVGWAGTLISLLSVVRQAGAGFEMTRRELARDWRDIKDQL